MPQTKPSSAVEVPLRNTPFTGGELRDYLMAGHLAARGQDPSPCALAIAWCQVCVEVRPSGAGCWNYNLGNIGCTDGWPICYDISPLLPPDRQHEQHWQRAYPDFTAAAADFWRLISADWYARHGTIEAMEACDIDGYAKALKAGGYYGASVEHYAAAMRQHWAAYRERWPDGLPPAQTAPGMPIWKGLAWGAVGLVAVGGVYLIARHA